MIDAATKRARAQTLTLAQSLNVTIEHGEEGRMYAINATAPSGHHFACDALHELASSCYKGPWSYAEYWMDIHDRIVSGVEPCNAECEFWSEND